MDNGLQWPGGQNHYMLNISHSPVREWLTVVNGRLWSLKQREFIC